MLYYLRISAGCTVLPYWKYCFTLTLKVDVRRGGGKEAMAGVRFTEDIRFSCEGG